MKRKGNLYEQVYSFSNLELADTIAQKGKQKQYGVITHNKNRTENLTKLQNMLMDKTFRTSQYTTFKVYEPKERLVFRLPYFPDRILHHAIMNVLEPMFVACFTADTYSCIKGRGIHSASKKLKNCLQDTVGTQYCLKMDIRKFYPSVDHAILKNLLRRKIKDNDLLQLLDEIIDSAEGLPIGNYLSQHFANYYLTGFDHWIKEVKKVKYYFRYADDIVVLAEDKPYLHQLRAEITQYLGGQLNLQVKGNYQVFPVAKRGIDFLGYVFFHSHTLLRKTIKKRFAKAVTRKSTKETIASYNGWAKHANTTNLLNKLRLHEEI
jgi:RNA-directed DNA polymerase